MNECDIAETCTGDSSQVCPAWPVCGTPGGATPVPTVLAVSGDHYSSRPSALLLASPLLINLFPHLRKGLFVPPGFAPTISFAVSLVFPSPDVVLVRARNQR